MKHGKLLFFIGLTVFIYLNNASWPVEQSRCHPFLLAHRGLGQTFSKEGINNTTNTARRIYTPEHPYLENTIPGIEAAFYYGADVAEIDIQQAKDKQIVIFHDRYLEYRTNAKGSASDYTLAELKKLDIGYGYTADSGKTYPFRGKGVGMMPTLDEVLQHFPHKKFLLHIKSGDAEDGILLAARLKELPPNELALLWAYGGDAAISALKEQLPQLRSTSKEQIKKNLLLYAATGWTGYVPASMKNTELLLPLKYAPYLWGWPQRFMQRMNNANTTVVLLQGGEYSEGFDDIADLSQLPDNYCGGIWTNRVDKIGAKTHQ